MNIDYIVKYRLFGNCVFGMSPEMQALNVSGNLPRTSYVIHSVLGLSVKTIYFDE